MDHVNGCQKKAGVDILMLDKIDFKTATRDKEGYYIIIKGAVQQEDTIIVNIYALSLAPKYIKQLITNIKKLINNNTIIVRDLNTPFTSMDKSSKQKVNKETMALNDTLEHTDLTDIFRTFHPKTGYTFFLSVHGTFSRIDYISADKTSLNKLKKIKVIPCNFSDHNTMKLKVNYNTKSRKNTNTWGLYNMLQ